MTAGQPEAYAASVRRMTRIIAIVAVAGTIVSAFIWRRQGIVGFPIGAGLSYLGFLRWRRVVDRLGSEGSAGPKAWLLALMPLAVALLLYAILKFSRINVMPVLAGLFVALAAAILEAFYQLYART
ncbi:MAG TPA: hypothetical protein VMJ34_12625 [Bryobacteraceae bacterium]|nr:hypothetical protein [Bryobacteraceae bacterium]